MRYVTYALQGHKPELVLWLLLHHAGFCHRMHDKYPLGESSPRFPKIQYNYLYEWLLLVSPFWLPESDNSETKQSLLAEEIF